MTALIENFITYLEEERKASVNTVLSYRRDLLQMRLFLLEEGISDAVRVTETSLNAYLLYLEKEGKAASTISREVAALKAFFCYLCREGILIQDPSELLRAPKITRKAPVILTKNEIGKLLGAPGHAGARSLRDRAMLEVLYGTGMRVSELVGLKVSDVDLTAGYVTCRDTYRERTIPLEGNAKKALEVYLMDARPALLKKGETGWLFMNCNGGCMSRQGLWKIIKSYGQKAGIEEQITPYTLRHAFAAHRIQDGADVQTVRLLLGHSDSTAMGVYAPYGGPSGE